MKNRLYGRLASGLLVLALALVSVSVPTVSASLAAASAGDVVINEIMQNPSAVSDSAGEWFELYNATGSAIDIDGWTIRDDDVDSHVINNSGPLEIPAGGFLVLGNNADTLTNGGVTLDYVYGSSWFLANGADEVVLLDESFNEIDRVEYDGGTAFPDPTGAAMALKDPTLDNNDGGNWCVASTPYGDGDLGTPGAENDCGVTPPPAPSVSIHDIQYTIDGDSPYKDQEVTTQGIVTAFFYDGGNRYTFIQDGTGPWSGLLLYKPSGYVNVGDLLQVTGTVSEYSDLTEIANGDATVLTSGNPLPAPEVLPTGDVSQEQWESVVVRVENVTVTQEQNYYGEWLLDDGSGNVMVDDLGYYAYAPQYGDSLSYVQGPLFYSYGDFKIEPRDDGDIDAFRSICQIQGDGLASAYDGQTVLTQGIVTADFQATAKRGFFLQDPSGDGDPATSDGIFVYDQWISVDVGDEIVITGEVSEYYDMTEISGVWGRFSVLSEDNPLPDPVDLNDLPNESMVDGTYFWEPLEGMLASVEDAPVVAPTSPYGEFGMLAKRDAKPGSGFYPETQQILIRSLGDGEVDYNPERIVADDESLDTPIVVMPGDRVRSLMGAVDYTFGMYKLQPVSFDVKTHNLPNLPASTRSGPNGDTVITTFNVENLFDLVDNPDKEDEGSTPSPEALETQLTKLALAIEVELELPEILIVQEVENTGILQELGNRVNTATGTDYQAVSFETSDVRGIEVGFLWDANRVMLLDAYQLSGPDIEAAFGPSSASPGREPLYGEFDIGGKVVHIVGNHFKSKSGDDALFGLPWPPERITEVQRKLQAQAVRDFVDMIFDADPEALVLVAGDLNDFQFGEPGEGDDHPVAILEGIAGEVPLTNLVNLEKDDERFTYLYDGNSQVLDHMLVSPALYDLFAAVDVLHFNASYPDGLGHDPTTPLKASDHDPLEGRFNLR